MAQKEVLIQKLFSHFQCHFGTNKAGDIRFMLHETTKISIGFPDVPRKQRVVTASRCPIRERKLFFAQHFRAEAKDRMIPAARLRKAGM